MASAAEEMASRFCRSFLTLHVFGSSGCGKKTFKRQWFESSHSRVLSEFADVHIRLQRDCSLEGCGVTVEGGGAEASQAFLILYRPDSQGSIAYAQECLEKIYSTFDCPYLEVTVLENHFEPTFKPFTEAPCELPSALAERVVGKRGVSPWFWRVSVLDSVLLLSVFGQVIIQPLLGRMGEDTKAQVIDWACRDGKVGVLKLLIGQVEGSDPAAWLTQTMATLEQPGSHSAAKYTSLVTIARFAYNLDPTLSMSAVVRLAERFPQASLMLLNDFCQQSGSADHFIKSGLALVHLPPSWVANCRFTHIDISNNLLMHLPTELFQLSTLRGLNASHNCIESIPAITKWNCPVLRDLNLSHNRLKDVPYSILTRGGTRRDTIIHGDSLPKNEGQKRHLTAAQRVLKLTGFNFYPCIHSLSRVNITKNSALSQIPEWVCVLPNLTLLEAKSLPRLTTITPYLAHCRYLCVLQVDTERIVSPPPGEAQRGTRAIMAYLRCKLRGCTPYRHVKLVLIGEKGSGKTTLFTQLLGKKAHSLPGIPNMEIASFEYPPRSHVRRDKPRVTFHVIDFAEDDVYESTHQCFLTYRSIFLCLWDITQGEDALRRLTSWLRSIHVCVPGSPVLLIGTHSNQRPALSSTTLNQWLENVFGETLRRLENSSHAARLGFPPIKHFLKMDCLSKSHVEHLMSDIYESVALQMKHPRTRVSLLEDTVPRSYQELQSLVELKVKSMRRDKYSVPVLKHEEFVDYVRSLTLQQHYSYLEEDAEEFALACRFLHEAGTIIHFNSCVPGMSDLYFLDPQWLFNVLGNIIISRKKSPGSSATVESGDLPRIFEAAEIPPQFYHGLFTVMESFDILVSLDMEKNHFLIPSLLPPTPPAHYPTYDLSTDDHTTTTQYIHFNYLPNSFFPRLLARVLIYIRQLSVQLLVAGSTPLTQTEDVDGGLPSKMISSLPTRLLGAHSFGLDRLGYVYELDDLAAAKDEGTLRRKICALSAQTLSIPLLRHMALTQKLVSLSKPILEQRRPTHTCSVINEQDPESVASRADSFSSYVFWKNGFFVEFPCGTKFWLEACNSAVALVISGAEIKRVKVLSFLTSCVDVLVEECFVGMEAAYYSPCPSCLKRFWEEGVPRDRGFSLSDSFGAEICEIISLNEFSGVAKYSQCSVGSKERRNSLTFSGSSLRLSHSPSPSEISASFEEDLPIAILENNITMIPLPTALLQSRHSSSIQCPKCEVLVELSSISPHILMVDFSDKFLLSPSRLRFVEEEASMLGSGGFAKVYRGTYHGEPVAVKIFQQPRRQDSLVQQYKDLREELTIMSLLSHPRVLALVGVALRPLCMVTQLAPQGSLSNHLELCPQGFDHGMAHRVLYQIADGIRYLHSLYIVHRDIKPSNVLVWSLHPVKGVDVRLADYGISQFSTPSGLHRHKGTEEYMAPELFHTHGSISYDEKVDIFSFALVLHLVVTGRKLFAGVVSKKEQLQIIYNASIPKLSQALSLALTDNQPQQLSAHHDLLEHGRHPAARGDVISSCHSVCMQRLMENCLSLNPLDRPTAQGICSKLLVCPGSLPQVNFFIDGTPVRSASYSSEADIVVAIHEKAKHVVLVPSQTWGFQHKAIPYKEEQICCLVCFGNEVFLASENTNLVFSLRLPNLTSGHISHEPLPGKPLCLIPHAPGGENRLVVGMTAGRIAVFRPSVGSGDLLENKPFVTQVVNHPDAQKTAISCGLYHHRTLWCGCGRYIIGLDTKEYLLKHYKPVIKEQTSVSRIAALRGYLWMGFEGLSELVVCNANTAACLDSIDCSKILGVSGTSLPQAVVSDVVSSSEAMWVGTRGGHLLAFDPLTAEVLLAYRRQSSISCVVCLSEGRLVTFGEGGSAQGEESDIGASGMFSVWTSYVAYKDT